MPANPPPIQVRSLDHITLVVKNLEQSRQFYCDVLGMREVERPPFSFAGSWFQAGATLVHTILEHDQSGPAGNPAAGRPGLTRTHHFAFLVDDARAAAERLQELGLPLVSPPKSRPDGAVQVFIRDPDGHIIELCTPAP